MKCISLPPQADHNWKLTSVFATRLGRQMKAAHIVSVLELVPTPESTHGQLKRHFTQWKREEISLKGKAVSSYLLLKFLLPSVVVLILLSSMKAGTFLLRCRCNRVCSGRGISILFVSPRLAHCVTDWIHLEGFVSLSASYRSSHCAFCGCTHQTLKHNSLPAFLRYFELHLNTFELHKNYIFRQKRIYFKSKRFISMCCFRFNNKIVFRHK